MAKSFKVKRGTYQRENLRIGSPITILTSVDLKLQESINQNLMAEAVMTGRRTTGRNSVGKKTRN